MHVLFYDERLNHIWFCMTEATQGLTTFRETLSKSYSNKIFSLVKHSSGGKPLTKPTKSNVQFMQGSLSPSKKTVQRVHYHISIIVQSPPIGKL